MYRAICYLITSLILLQSLKAQQFGSFKDPRDGKVYKTVKIGDQVWMAENLNATKFRNGDTIHNIVDTNEWHKTESNKRPAWCEYDYENPSYSTSFNSVFIRKMIEENHAHFGKLYNWFAVKDPRGLAPEGWHIPSKAEVNELIVNVLGDDLNENLDLARGRLLLDTTDFWGHFYGSHYGGNNSSGFSALPYVIRSVSGIFRDIRENSGCWWTSTKSRIYSGGFFKKHGIVFYSFTVTDGPTKIIYDSISPSYGFSVRCVKD